MRLITTLILLSVLSSAALAEVTFTNYKAQYVSNVQMGARMVNGSLKIDFFYTNKSGNYVLWTGKGMTQCAVYENNGNFRSPSMGTKRAWTGNVKLKSHSQPVYMNNVYVNDFNTNSAIVQCYIELKNFSRNLRSTFMLYGS